MKKYQQFLKSKIDLSAIGIEARSENIPYFCTPKGASVIGWAGVDGIHFCFIRGFGEMVFSVSPMNSAPNFVHPLAKDFTDFLRLLLACGDSAALEQAWQCDEPQFDAFLEENSPTEEQRAVLYQITKQMCLAPMEHPWQYIKQLQSSFDYRNIPYTEDYYDTDMNPDAPQEPPEWKVFFDGNLWGHPAGQRAGKEIPLEAHFDWAGHHWVIPAIYSCAKGMVVDFCMQVKPADIQAFMQKWNLDIETEACQQFTKEQQMQIDLDNPLHLDFDSVISLNGKELQNTHGCGTVYIPCLPSGYHPENEAKWVVEHYRLDPTFGWVIMRCCYTWATKRKPEIKTLSVAMIQHKLSVPGPHFRVHAPGDTFSFTHPDSGTEYTLTVQEYESQTLNISRMALHGMEFPTHLYAMSYVVTPEMPDDMMTITDCAEGDRPRQKQPDPNAPSAMHDAATIGIIGGADGPTAIFIGQNRQSKLRAVCSNLHYEPVEDVEWQIMFQIKQYEDTTVCLLTS